MDDRDTHKPADPRLRRPYLTLRGVTLRHTHLTLDWTLRQGEHWAIVGPAGSGKSILARTLAGALPPAAGEVRWLGLQGGQQTHPQRVYLTFDRRNTSPFHQARWHAHYAEASPLVQEVLTPARLWQRNPFEIAPTSRAVPEGFWRHRQQVIHGLGLEALLTRRVHQLSDGEWRRLQIARGLLQAPMLLILDDPLTGLDAAIREGLDCVLQDLRAPNTHLVLVAPETMALPSAITHVLVLRQGRVIAAGPRQAVLSQHALEHSRQRPPHHPSQYTPDGPTVIRLQNVSIRHGTEIILEDITWQVRHGEKWALLGPNGAGKSTLLSLILGDHPQVYANNVTLFGRRRGSGESVWEIKRRIGWVAPELHHAFPLDVPVLDVIRSGFFDALDVHRRCTPAQDAQASTWLDSLGLTQWKDVPFRQLSKGQQRLVLIARALIKNPELLILDEPCQGLDAAQRAQVLTLLEELTAQPEQTMIYVTHIPEEMPGGLTHVLELSAGRVVRCQTLPAGGDSHPNPPRR